MEDIRNYLQMMIESLQKKENVLKNIELIVQEQAQILSVDNIDQVAFDDSMARKADLIEELERLNDGFEHIYDRIKEGLVEDKEKYASYIKQLQDLISRVSEKSILIETMEERNKNRADTFFSLRHREIKSLKQSSAVANSYQRAMAGSAYKTSGFDVKTKK